MEKDAFIMHGVAEVVKDRMFIQSDKFATHVCRVCGDWAIDNQNIQRVCRACGVSGDNIAPIQITYISKLVFQYLSSIGISPRVLVDPKHEE